MPGSTEAQAGLRAGYETTLAMLDALGPSYSGQLSSTDGASAGYRGQVGRRSAWAHAVAHNIPFEAGQVSSPRPRAGLGLQRRARARDDHRHTRPTRCGASSTTRSPPSRRLRRSAPRRHLRRRRSRCARLPRGERPPALLAPARRPRDRPPQPRGAVPRRRRLHPGRARDGVHDRARLYDDQIGGFRHSDTVVVTEDGIDILTSYPRDIESLTIPA